MSFLDGVTGEVNPAKLLCFVPVILGLERPFLGRKNDYPRGRDIANLIKHLALW